MIIRAFLISLLGLVGIETACAAGAADSDPEEQIASSKAIFPFLTEEGSRNCDSCDSYDPSSVYGVYGHILSVPSVPPPKDIRGYVVGYSPEQMWAVPWVIFNPENRGNGFLQTVEGAEAELIINKIQQTLSEPRFRLEVSWAPGGFGVFLWDIQDGDALLAWNDSYMAPIGKLTNFSCFAPPFKFEFTLSSDCFRIEKLNIPKSLDVILNPLLRFECGGSIEVTGNGFIRISHPGQPYSFGGKTTIISSIVFRR